ncbi:uncharacterized protein DEA37_0012456, partial [Paragonimus westermani]
VCVPGEYSRYVHGLQVIADAQAFDGGLCIENVAVPITPFDRTISVSREHFTTSNEANQNSNLSTSHVSSSILCHEPLLRRPNVNRSSPFLADRCSSVFTAASGLHSHTPVRHVEEQETASSNASEIEDMCLDNSSQDSFIGSSNMSHISRTILQPPSVNAVPNSDVMPIATQSHCRLRTVLLNTSNNHPIQSSTPSATVHSPEIRGHLSIERSEHVSPATARSLVISRKPEPSISFQDACETKNLVPLNVKLSLLQKDESSPIRSSFSLPTASSVSSDPVRTPSVYSTQTTFGDDLSQCASSRLPSAPNSLRRISSEVSVERPFSQVKSISQPQSPEFRSRRLSLPVSPCRLPMKKRKLNWNHMDQTLNRCSTEPLHPASAPHSMSGFSFSPREVKWISNSPPPEQYAYPTGPTPLVVDCPVDLIDNHISRLTGDVSAPSSLLSHSSSNSCDLNADDRPRSIPAPLPPPLATIAAMTTIRNQLNATSDSPSNSTILKQSYQNLVSPYVRVTKSDQSSDHSTRVAESKSTENSKFSLLLRTLTTNSKACHIEAFEPACKVSNTTEPQPRCVASVRPDSTHVPVATDTHSRVVVETLPRVNFFQTVNRKLSQTESGATRSTSAGTYTTLSFSNSETFSKCIDPSSAPSFNNTHPAPVVKFDSKSITTDEKQRQIRLSDIDAEVSSRDVVTTFRSNLLYQPTFSVASSIGGISNRPACAILRSNRIDTGGAAKQHGSPVHVVSHLSSERACELPLARESTKNGVLRVTHDTSGQIECNANQQAGLSANRDIQQEFSNIAQASQSNNTTSDVSQTAQILMMLSPPTKSVVSDFRNHNELDGRPTHVSQEVVIPDGSLIRSLNGPKSNFPLFLISATSSAGAAALAAAAALATGAPPSSLIPVPVQLTAYVPPASDKLKTTQSIGKVGSAHNTQRLVISIRPTSSLSEESTKISPLVVPLSIERNFIPFLRDTSSTSSTEEPLGPASSSLTMATASKSSSRLPVPQAAAIAHLNA